MLPVQLGFHVGSFKANSFPFLMLMSSQCLYDDHIDMIKANITYIQYVHRKHKRPHKKTTESICMTPKLKKKKSLKNTGIV